MRAMQAAPRRDALVGVSPAISHIKSVIDKIAPTDVPVLIQGETGTGKELVAGIIHSRSARRHQPFTVIDCSTLAPAFVESELFGYAAGAFPGVPTAGPGLLRSAGEGTIVLDQVEQCPLQIQPKLLRAIQAHEVLPVGESSISRFDARILAASSCDLGDLVHQGRFRADLHFRLNVVVVSIPPLRERKEDIPALVQDYLLRLGLAGRMRISEEGLQQLMAYDWPGNVRQLEHTLDRAVIFATSDTLAFDASDLTSLGPRSVGPAVTLRKLKEGALREALRQAKGNKVEAARLLGVGKTTVYRLLKELGRTPSVTRGR